MLDVLADAYPPTFIASKVAVHTSTRTVDEVGSSKYWHSLCWQLPL